MFCPIKVTSFLHRAYLVIVGKRRATAVSEGFPNILEKKKITSLQFRIFLLWMPVVHYLFFPLKVMAVKTVLFAIKLMHFWACLWQHFMSMVKYQGSDRRHLIFSRLQYLRKKFYVNKTFFFLFKLSIKVRRDGETSGVRHMTHFTLGFLVWFGGRLP